MGDNTAGMTHFGNLNDYYLNNSNIRVSLGSSYFSFNFDNFIEGIGDAPDIYIPFNNKKAILAVNKFISKQL